jgi:hypothetical protein
MADGFKMLQGGEHLSRAKRHQMKKLATGVNKITDADRKFFERFPHRQYRVRLAARAEIKQDTLLNGASPHLPREFFYFMAVKKIAPGVRVRLRIIGLEGSDTDLSEESARAIYEMACTPEAEALERQLAELRP